MGEFYIICTKTSSQRFILNQTYCIEYERIDKSTIMVKSNPYFMKRLLRFSDKYEITTKSIFKEWYRGAHWLDYDFELCEEVVELI